MHYNRPSLLFTQIATHTDKYIPHPQDSHYKADLQEKKKGKEQLKLWFR